MQKIIFTLLAICFLLGCNKDTTEIEVPPFSAFPNPFVNQLILYFDTSQFPNSEAVIRILDGSDKELKSVDFNTVFGSALIQMSEYEKGIYYVEMDLGGKTFNLPVLKAE